MPITSQWGNPQRTFVSTTFTGEWRWAELHNHEQGALSSLLSSEVPLLMDMRRGVWIKPESLDDEVSRSAGFHQRSGVRLVVILLADVATGRLLVQHYRRQNGVCEYIHAMKADEADRLIEHFLSSA